MTIHDHLKDDSPTQAIVGSALVEFAESLVIGSFRWESDSKLWVFRYSTAWAPRDTGNYVALMPRPRVKALRLSLYGRPHEFDGVRSQHLSLEASRWNWSKTKITSARQLSAAAAYIEQAWENYKAMHPYCKGRERQ